MSKRRRTQSDDLSRSDFEKLWEEMEAEGIITRTGE
jgi:hypothetical protein